jgi:hypothetical protein
MNKNKFLILPDDEQGTLIQQKGSFPCNNHTYLMNPQFRLVPAALSCHTCNLRVDFWQMKQDAFILMKPYTRTNQSGNHAFRSLLPGKLVLHVLPLILNGEISTQNCSSNIKYCR